MAHSNLHIVIRCYTGVSDSVCVCACLFIQEMEMFIKICVYEYLIIIWSSVSVVGVVGIEVCEKH